jgi:hypothetical protein
MDAVYLQLLRSSADRLFWVIDRFADATVLIVRVDAINGQWHSRPTYRKLSLQLAIQLRMRRNFRKRDKIYSI